MSELERKKEALRKKSLGELGELFAVKALVDARYDRVRNLNDDKMNFPFADLYGEFNGEKQVISIKARNKYQTNGKINSSYNLGNNCYAKAQKAEEAYGAKAYWMAIQFDKTTYSIYFGALSDLADRNSIPLSACENGSLGKCLVKDKKHYFDFDYFSNIKPSQTASTFSEGQK